MKAKIDLEKFIYSYVKWNNIQDALKDQGLKCCNGEIVEIPQESEDERIKKEILELISISGNGNQFEEIKDWLEKQGDTNETINRDELVQGVLRGAAINLITWIDYNAAEGNMCLSNMECKDIADALVSGDWDKIYAYIKKKLEKQEKQKPAFDFNVVDWQPSKVDGKIHNIYNYEVEPKFKVGDFVCDKNGEIAHIEDIKVDSYGTLRYYVRWSNGNKSDPMPCFFDENHLWTIRDAKDGDVLCYKDEISLYKHDIKNCTKQEPTFGGFVYYCCYDGNKFITDSLYSLTEQDKIDIYPATKEQRDLLFQKMHEAGYEWDVENKKLIQLKKQSEQKPVDKIELNFHEGDWIVYKNEVCQIVKREEGCNKLVTVFGIEKELVNERNLSTARLWTIQDAKDGDVLVCEGQEYLLFKSYTDGRIKLHCWYNEQTNNFHLSADVKLRQESTICPATKEQRDLLFQKMREEGYERDGEKKELRRLEKQGQVKESNISQHENQTCKENSNSLTGFKLPIKWTQDNIDDLTEFEAGMMYVGESFFGEYAGLNPNDTMSVRVQANLLLELVKPKWTEEDEKMVDELLRYFAGLMGVGFSYWTERMIAWLKSFKQRMEGK